MLGARLKVPPCPTQLPGPETHSGLSAPMVLSDGAVRHLGSCQGKEPTIIKAGNRVPGLPCRTRMTTTHLFASYGICTTRETTATPSRTKQVSEHPGEGSRAPPPETSRWGRRSSFPRWRLISPDISGTPRRTVDATQSVWEDLLMPSTWLRGSLLTQGLFAPHGRQGLKREQPRSRFYGSGACALCSVSERVSASHPIQTRTARRAAHDICGGSRSGGWGDMLVAPPSAPYVSPNV